MFEFAALFVAFYVYHMLGITVGYHRLLAHRSFDCPKWVEYFFVMGGYLGFQSSPIWWATIHRGHHRFVDTPQDPHSPRYGMWNSFIGWAFKDSYTETLNPDRQSKDLTRDKLYMFLEQGGDWRRMHLLNSFIGFSSRLILLGLFGWQVALASVAAGLAAQQMPFLLNFICHLPFLGYRNFKDDDDSVNVPWVAFLTTGEGWHNNHHHAPGSAKSGLKWWEIDPAWMTIKTMSMFGLVSRMNVHKDTTVSARAKKAAAVTPRTSPVQIQVSTVAKRKLEAQPIAVVEAALNEKQLVIAK
ncbi:MAG: fatty acid desaturase [Cyanobacteria bacterium REEB67]|nr:fatty acid desaturase [Cyanobacteria bacterium REEB67]